MFRLVRKSLELSLYLAVMATVVGVGPFVGRAVAAAAISDDPVAISLHTSFDHFWRRYAEAAAASDIETAERMLEEIRRLRVERNAFALNDVGTSFAYQGYALLAAGSIEQAREHFQIARELSPDLPVAYRGLASAAQQSGGIGHATALLHRARAHLASIRSTRDGPYARWNLAVVFFTALMVVFLIFSAVLVYRYGVLLAHDLEERVGELIGSRGSLAAAAALLCLPLIVTAGVVWLAPYWMSLTFGYQSKKERGVSAACLLVLLLAAPFVQLYAEWVRTVSNPVYQAALSSTTGTFDIDDVLTLRDAARESPEDRDLQFLLAIQFKNLGDYELAADQYRRILQAFPGDLASMVNLGNIYFAQRDWEGALGQYNDALAANPRLAMAHYNKSLAHAENFQFAEREDARARAETIDPSAVVLHEERTGDYRAVADEKLDHADIFSKFAGLSEGMHARRMGTLAGVSWDEGWGARFIIAPLMFGALILLLELLFRERKLTQRCWKCGSAFCGRCQIGTGRKGLCTQCYHLYFMKDGVSSEARNLKLAQVQRSSTMRMLIFRVLSLIAPGAGQVSDGKPIMGSLLLLVWVLGACVIFLTAPYSLPLGLLSADSGPPVGVAAMMFIAFIVANLSSRPMARG